MGGFGRNLVAFSVSRRVRARTVVKSNTLSKMSSSPHRLVSPSVRMQHDRQQLDLLQWWHASSTHTVLFYKQAVVIKKSSTIMRIKHTILYSVTWVFIQFHLFHNYPLNSNVQKQNPPLSSFSRWICCLGGNLSQNNYIILSILLRTFGTRRIKVVDMQRFLQLRFLFLDILHRFCEKVTVIRIGTFEYLG